MREVNDPSEQGSRGEVALLSEVHSILPQEHDALAGRAAAWLHGRGMRRGDRVAVVAPNDPRLLAFAHGALRTGVVPVFVDPALRPPERAWILEDCDPATVLEDLDTVPWEEDREVELAALPLGQPMLYTSGTTGRPKGVWRGVLSEGEARAWADDERDLWSPEPGAAFLVCSPLYHSAAYRSATSALLAGSRVLLLDRFDSGAVVELLASEPVTGAFLVPTHLRRIFAMGDPPPARAAKRILHAGEQCPDPLKRRALGWLGDALWEFYGSTEGQFTAISPGEWLEHPGSVGRARSGRRLRIADPDADGIGTVFVSAPAFARWEYWRDPARTARAWRDDLFTVGDLGRLDRDGYLYLATRREDLIISGGVNVYPAQIEQVLLEHRSVQEAAVFGAPDPVWGQRVCAAVVTDDGREELVRWLRDRLDGPQRPKEVIVVETIPRTATGKIDRSALVSLVRPGDGRSV
jgi:acyl-CoA synthetase (AMP-forming)/AMP-acid ligase II